MIQEPVPSSPATQTLDFAGLGVRLAAMGIDFLILAGYGLILALVAVVIIRTTGWEQRLNSAIAGDILAFVTLVLPVILYFSFQEGSSRQATIGKRRMGLKVIDSQGNRMSFGRALLRSVLKFLPWQLAHTAIFQIRYGNDSGNIFGLSIVAQLLVIIYLLSIWLDKQRRAPYDFLAGSRVTRTKSG